MTAEAGHALVTGTGEITALREGCEVIHPSRMRGVRTARSSSPARLTRTTTQRTDDE